MNYHDFWRLEYKHHRYMEFLSQKEIEVRVLDLFANMLVLGKDGRIALHDNDQMLYWMKLWSHVLEELSIRGDVSNSSLQNGFLKNAKIVNPTFPKTSLSLNAIQKIGGAKDGYIYKFGKYKYLKEMFEKGSIRICAASSYNDPSLNSAIRDDELNLNIQVKANSIEIIEKNGSYTKTKGKIDFHLRSPTNYYVYCFASKYTYR